MLSVPTCDLTARTTKGADLEFAAVVKCCEELSKATARPRRVFLVEKLWEMYGRMDHNLFPLLRLLLPHLDSERPMYKVKEKQLAKMYVALHSLPEGGSETRELLNWKRPSNFNKTLSGNFPDKAISVVERRCLSRADLPEYLSVRQLNKLLDDLALAEPGAGKLAVFKRIHERTTAVEQKWILRVILRDMTIGFKEDSIFKLLHPDAQELYNTMCDLEGMCAKCRDPSFRQEEIHLTLFKPLRPRTALRGLWRDVDRVMRRKGPYVAQYKLDGDRVMLHFDRHPAESGARGGGGGGAYEDSDDEYGGGGGGGDKGDPHGLLGGARVEWWTRNTKNFTSGYGEPFAPILQEVLPPSLTSCVLDGEMMVYDPDTGDYAPFGENRSMFDWRRAPPAPNPPRHHRHHCHHRHPPPPPPAGGSTTTARSSSATWSSTRCGSTARTSPGCPSASGGPRSRRRCGGRRTRSSCSSSSRSRRAWSTACRAPRPTR